MDEKKLLERSLKAGTFSFYFNLIVGISNGFFSLFFIKNHINEAKLLLLFSVFNFGMAYLAADRNEYILKK